MSIAHATGPLNRRFKLRSDLQWSLYSKDDQSTWVARSPISLEYFYFGDLEKRLLWLLNGSRTVGEVAQHPWAASLGQAWIIDMVMKAQAANLLLPADGPGMGEGIWRTIARGRERRRLQWLLSPLAIRVKLFDPSRLLELLAPVSRLLFSRTLALLSMVSIPFVVYFVVLQLLASGRTSLIGDSLGQLNSEQLLVLLFIYLVMKSFHELGHALACKKWTAECHEIGVLFLVFAPCLYCDTTDSWKLTSRWRRAAIAAAGIYCEVLMSTAAAIVWLLTQPTSSLHWVAAYTMAIGSVSTVLVNANPLLRYDGYYILSDLWRVPNLADQSREALRTWLARLLTGTSMPVDKWDARPITLIVYQIAAKCYRAFLLVMIVMVVWLTLDRWGLRLIGMLLVGMTLTTATLGAIFGTTSFLKEVNLTGRIRRYRAGAVVVAACLVLWMVMSVEWPSYLSARAISSVRELHPIYARQSGRLVEFAPLGSLVPKGAPLVRLQSSDLDLELLSLEGTIAELQERLTQLRLALVDDDQAAFELGNTIEQIAKNQSRRDVLQMEIDSLSVVAEFDGRLIPSNTRPQVALAEADHLGIWNPVLSTAHLDATIERGTLLGWLAEHDSIELTALVPEYETERLSPGMKVACRWDCQAGSLYQGVVQRIAAEPLESTPEILAGDPSFVADTRGGPLSSQTSGYYEVKIMVSNCPPAAVHQSLATVHIETTPSTLWDRIYRFYSKNIRPQFLRQNRLAINKSNIGSAMVCAVRSLNASVNTWSN